MDHSSSGRLTPVIFYFLRHGETDWNRRRVMQGQTDIDMNANGLAQAEAVAAVVGNIPIATVCSSPLKRARVTAEIVNRRLGKPLIEIPQLMECRFGIYEGQDSGGAWRGPWEKGAALPGGETFDGYRDRALLGLNKALAYPAPVLVVAHGGTFWAVEKFALNGKRVRIPNCVLFKIDPPAREGEEWTVTELAAPPHPLAIGEAGPSSQ